jgi:hypothetical protein
MQDQPLLDRISLNPKVMAGKPIIVTNDKDLSEKVYRERRLHKGVVLLRLHDERASSKIDPVRGRDSHSSPSRSAALYLVVHIQLERGAL